MSNSLARVKYTVTFFSDKNNFLDITEDQYGAIKPLLNDYRFVEINGTSYNTADIRSINKTIDLKNYLMKVGDKVFYSQEEFDAYQEKL